MRFGIVLTALALAAPVHAANFAANGIASCEVYSFFLAHPEAVTQDLSLQLSLVESVAEATGLPRGSFRADFTAVCKQQPNLTPDEVIKMVFKKYLKN